MMTVVLNFKPFYLILQCLFKQVIQFLKFG